MAKERNLVGVDVTPELLEELRATGKAGDMTAGKFVRMLIDEARPSFPQLALIFAAAKAQKMEAFDHLQSMAGRATVQAGNLQLDLVEKRRAAQADAAQPRADRVKHSKTKRNLVKGKRNAKGK